MIKKHIPNSITCLNLFSGCLGITFAFNGQLEVAALFIAIAAFFDFFDGMAARLLNVKSAIGKDLDSLADVVSFGVLPSVIVFQLMKASTNFPWNEVSLYNPFPYLAFLIAVFSALRLAKFNNDLRQTDSFIGLPTPASAIFLGSIPLIIRQTQSSNHLEFLNGILGNYYILLTVTLIISWLLIAEIPLFSLKFKNLQWKNNKAQYLLLAFSVLAILLFSFAAVPVIIVAYILLSLVF
jgi:CDP-diacylglycerol---serine O-phosphatidyltransferase